jgi:hypothetical protein
MPGCPEAVNSALRVFEIDQRQPEDRITGAVLFLQARGVLS